MSLVDEIAVKIGADPTALKAALADSDASIKGFGASGEKSVGGLFDAMENRLTSYRNLSTAVFTALGLNFEKLGEDIARFVTGMSKETEEGYKKLDESNTTSTDKLLALKAQIFAASYSNWTEEDKLNQLLAARAIIDQHLEDNMAHDWVAESLRNAQKIEFNRLIVQQAQNELDITKARSEIEKARTAEWDAEIKFAIALGEEERKTYEASLSANNEEYGFNLRILDIKQNIAIAQSVLASGALDEKNTAQWINKLAAEKKDLVVAEAAAEKDHVTIMFSLFDAQTKITNEAERSVALYTAIQTGDSKQLQILQLQTKEKTNQAEIDHLLRNGIDMLTPKEMDRLNLLTGQNKVIDAQIASLKLVGMNLEDQVKTIKEMPVNQQAAAYDALIKKTQDLHDSTVAQLGTENDVTAAMVAQISALKTQKDQVDGMIAQWEGYQGMISGKGDYASMSDAMLAGVVSKAQAALQIVKQANLATPGFAQNVAGGANASMDLLTANDIGDNLNLAGAQEEIALRSQIRNYANIYGQNAAVSQFGDSEVSRAMSATATSTQNIVNATTAIAQTLNNVFPGQATPVTTTH